MVWNKKYKFGNRFWSTKHYIYIANWRWCRCKWWFKCFFIYYKFL